MPQPSTHSLALFLTVVGFCLAAFVAAVAWTADPHRRTRDAGVAAVAVILWVGLLSVPTMLGWVSADEPLPAAPLQVTFLSVVAVGLVVSPLGTRLANGLPLAFLVGVQGMRLPLEIVLHWWADEGVAPPQMTWTGENIDIVAGIVCLGLAPFADRSRAAAWLSQIVGIALLANVFRVVVLSLPTPLQSFDEPLLLPFFVPTAWIATVCVMTAVLFHGLAVRRLLGAQAAQPVMSASS